MDIQQIRIARREMEDEIHEAVKSFQSKTGMCPHGIAVRLVEVTTVDEREKRYVVAEVRADVPL